MTKKRAALYCRVSTEGQAEDGYSLDEQSDRLVKYCEAHDYEVVKIYRDSSTGANRERPGLQAFFRDIKEYDILVVYKLDRFSRSQKDTLAMIDELLASGCEFVSMTEHLDSSSPFGRLMISILSAFAELERGMIRERSALGVLGRAKSGKAMAWHTPPFGYKYDGANFVIDDVPASVVKKIFTSYLNGYSISQIVDTLNNEGHVGRKRDWTYGAIRDIIANATYTGLNAFKGELYDGNHEAIIEHKIYEQAQIELKRRQTEAYSKGNPRPFQSQYLLSGLLRCGECDAGMGLFQNGVKKDGSRKKYYKCYTRLPKSLNKTMWRNPAGCHSSNIELTAIEYLVLREVERLRLDPNLLSEIATPESPVAEISAITERLSELDRAFDRLGELYIDGGMPRATLDRKRDALQNEKDALTARLEILNDNRPELSLDDARELLAGFTGSVRNLEHYEQKRLLNALLSRITVTSEFVHFKWRFV
jgi:site-specific DNA recombinase